MTSFENQWAFDRCKQNCGTFIDNFYENDRHQKCIKTDSCDISTSTNTISNKNNSGCNNKNNNNNTTTTTSFITPNIKYDNNDNDDNFVDDVTVNTTSTFTNKNNHLNYRYQKVYQDGTDKTGYYTNTFFANNIKGNEPRNNNYIELNQNHNCIGNQERFDCNMGSNVSRNTAKGLSGRRTQSSGSLYIDSVFY